MKRSTFWFSLFSLNIFLLVLSMYQHNYVVGLSYTKQRLAAQLTNLGKRKEVLLAQRARNENPAILTQFAQTDLEMQPCAPSQLDLILSSTWGDVR